MRYDMSAGAARSLTLIAEHAACSTSDTEAFFPDANQPSSMARRVCSSCPVRTACFGVGLALDAEGIWGGADQETRRTVARQQRKASA